MESATCPHCFKNYTNTSAKNRHIKKIHPSEVQVQVKTNRIYCPLCVDEDKQGMASSIALIKHFRDQHNVLIEEEKSTFSNLEEFENWMKLEYRNVDYTTNRTWKENCKTVKSYSCNRSNTRAFKSNCTKYLMKKGGSIKINGVCPSRITAQFYNEGKVEVRFIKTHVGHENELRTRRLTPEEQNKIDEKMRAGVSLDRIVRDAQKVQNGKIERINLLQMDDLKYQRRKNGIGIKRDTNDAIATSIKVQEWNSDGKNYAFLFKNIGDSHPLLKESDFALGFMNKTMEQKLKQFSRIICMDGTHCTNYKKYDLTVMMVKDHENMGFPVAFFLSNRQDRFIQEVFLKALKDRIGEEITPEYFMSDGDAKYYEAWKTIMGNSPRRLLCTWHVLKNWNQRGKPKITNKSIQTNMGKDLREIMTATKEECFIALKNTYLKKLEEENEVEFLNYLQKMHFKDEETEKKWAYCYRLHAGINTNMALESFNNFLKKLLTRNATSSIERLCDAFDDAVDRKMWKTIVNMERPNSNSYQDRQIAKAHKKAEQRNLNDDVKLTEFGKFQVRSSMPGENFYSVVYGEVGICSCVSLLCRVCNICKHKYVCECPEYAVKNVMCKHVHMVSLYERGVLAESVLDEEAKNEELENFYIKETSEEKCKLREAANEFLEEKCQDLDKNENAEENIDVETYKDIFFKNLANDINLNLPDFKKLAAQLTSVVRQFQGNTPTKRKMEKQTYYPQPQKKQRK